MAFSSTLDYDTYCFTCGKYVRTIDKHKFSGRCCLPSLTRFTSGRVNVSRTCPYCNDVLFKYTIRKSIFRKPTCARDF
ncbi:hypothetical protein [Mandarin fish ranavirus]|nr:hypothetical protein [Mandarin fish ranavirus]